MANKQRGEVDLKVDGKTFPLCLTLGALAAMEDALGVVTAGELDDIIKRPTYRQMLDMAHCLINFRAEDGKEVMSRRELELSDLTWSAAYFGVVDAIVAMNPAKADAGNDEGGKEAAT